MTMFSWVAALFLFSLGIIGILTDSDVPRHGKSLLILSCGAYIVTVLLVDGWVSGP